MNVHEIKQRAQSELVVIIEQEGGYKQYIWFPGMTGPELEAWWMALDDVDPFRRVEQETKVRLRQGWPGDFIEADQRHELWVLWDDLLEISPYYAQIYWNWEYNLSDPDTFLRRRDGTVFQHRGAFSDSVK